MRNYYPITFRQIQDEVPYTVTVNLRDGSGYTEDFPSYSTAMEYYESFSMGGYNDSPNVSHTSLRPTATPQSQADAELRAVIEKL